MVAYMIDLRYLYWQENLVITKGGVVQCFRKLTDDREWNLMKRIFSILLLIAMLFSLGACGAKETVGGPAENQTDAPTVTEEQITTAEETEAQLVAPNGMTMKETRNYGVPTIRYAGTTIPQGLGLPMLTDEEIDALLAENDPRKVKDTITTLADFVNYCYRGKFIFGDGLIFLYNDGNSLGQTTSSGFQTLERRIGQCASMSSCLHYVLADDYEEVGYVWIDGHVMAYILCDDLYYLINPVEYVSTNGRWPNRWLEYLPNAGVIYCSPDFQDIADSIYGKVIGTRISFVYTFVSPGDYTQRSYGEFPIGTTGIRWYGQEPVRYYLLTEYDWVSQESVVEEAAIVMYEWGYAPEGDEPFIFSGVHEDSKTGKLTPNTPEDVPDFIFSENATVIEYLKGIGAITFSKEELATLAETGDMDEICRVITTGEDCTQLIAASGIKEGGNSSIESAFAKKRLNPDKIVELSCQILNDDYEEVGMITTTPSRYYYLYVKQDEQYIIYDVLKATHTGQGVNGQVFDSDENMLNYAVAQRNDDSAVMKAWPW